MSWLRDPQLFIYVASGTIGVCRLNKTLSVGTGFNPATDCNNLEGYSFSRHLSLGINKESDYATFISYLRNKPNSTLMNSQGWVAADTNNGQYTLSREDPSSPVYNLSSILIASIDEEQQQKQALDRKVSELESLISPLRNKEYKLTAEVSDLQKQLIQEKSDKQALQKKASDNIACINNENKLTAEISDLQQQLELEKADRVTDKQALEKKVSELTSKLEESCDAGCGSADEEQWMTGHAVPDNWVPFDDLDVQTFPKDHHLTIMKVMGVLPKFSEENTTNVQAKHFYRGIFPIVVVNINELITNQDEARFDPEVWSLYRNQGTSYAARRPYESEMLANTQKTRQ